MRARSTPLHCDYWENSTWECGICDMGRIFPAQVALKWVYIKGEVSFKYTQELLFSSLQKDAKPVNNPIFRVAWRWAFCGARFFHTANVLENPALGSLCALSRQVCSADVTSLTSTIIISEEFLTVICWVGFFHLSNSISWHFPLEGWGEKRWAIVAFWGWRCAERSDLKGEQRKC